MPTRRGRSYSVPPSSSTSCVPVITPAAPLPLEVQPFPADLEWCIELCEKRVAAGIDVEFNKKNLEVFLKQRDRLPKTLTVEHGEPEGLTPAVYQRISELKGFLAALPDLAEFPGVSKDAERENIEAVLSAYRSGDLTVELGKVSRWSKGKMIAPLKERSMEEVLECARPAQASGSFWLEDPANAKRRAKAFVQVPATHAVTSA